MDKTARERRLTREFIGEVMKNGSPFLKFITRWCWAFVLVPLVGGIVLNLITRQEIFVIVGFGSAGLIMMILVFSFLISLSLGGLKDDPENVAPSLETEATLRAVKEMSRDKNKKHAKLWVFITYGWLFLVFLSMPVFMMLGGIFGWGILRFLGFILFGATMFGLIFFGAVIPSIRRGRGIRAVKRDRNTHLADATVAEIHLLSANSMNGRLVSEKFLITFDTPYGKSKTTFKVKRGQEMSFAEGDKTAVLINPSKPEYCMLPK